MESQELFAESGDINCSLEDDDIQCGHVAYNNHSHVLKFTCSFCKNSYDNIEYFCQHLSGHINNFCPDEEEFAETNEEEFVSDEGACADFGESPEKIADTNEEELVSDAGACADFDESSEKLTQTSSASFEDNKGVIIYGNADFLQRTEEDCSDINNEWEDADNYANLTDMLIEEVDDTGEAVAKHSQEDNVSPEVIDHIGDKDVGQKIWNNNKNIFNNIKNSEDNRLKFVSNLKKNIRPNKKLKFQDMLRLKRKRKKVTTVKVIAVKNRVAEIYERIKKQQDKSQRLLTANDNLPQELSIESSNTIFMEQETQDATETNSTNDEVCYAFNENTNSPRDKHAKDVTHQIIGETLITLIPEGTKTPNTLPSLVERLDTKTNLSDYHKTINYSDTLLKPSNNNEQAVCPACGKIFRSHFSLTIHKRIHYLESDSLVKLAHKCSDCDHLFNKLSQLKEHVEAVHYPDGFVCKICNRRLSSLSLLERHMLKVHLDRPFNCQECGKNFAEAITFEKHISSHTSGEVYKCHICGRKYSTEHFLAEHLRNHKEQMPQTCVVCGKVTLRITQHMKKHTPRPKRLLSCSVCGKVFNFSSGLSHHFKIMHKLPRPPPKPKKETNPVVQKRKRNVRIAHKQNKSDILSSTRNPIYNCSADIIEEPSEVPEEVYDEEDAQSILHLTASSEQNDNSTYQSDSESCQKSNLDRVLRRCPVAEEDFNHKEEEAKRVIVELIHNPDNLSVTPPIAREETISAVNSIC